ncbi:hypothetical protein Syun_000819 [Stephania yunnanensis]|uniref:1-phosphatidylinositol-4-phosphate 5-kinase n=1 Tax=Stephania yunnanensis TaxID=152371 RepID=A0AAP0LI78_9MAGN
MASVSRLVSKDCSLDRNQPDLRFRANLGAGGKLCTSNVWRNGGKITTLNLTASQSRQCSFTLCRRGYEGPTLFFCWELLPERPSDPVCPGAEVDISLLPERPSEPPCSAWLHKLCSVQGSTLWLWCWRWRWLPKLCSVQVSAISSNLKALNLREMFKIDAADYMMSICGNDALRVLSSPGKSGISLCTNGKHVLHRTRIHRRFDLKGSSLGRSTDNVEIDENTILERFGFKLSLLGKRLRASAAGDEEVDLLLPGTARLQDLVNDSYGQSLSTSTFIGETILAILIAIFGLVLFAHLIGNMQSVALSVGYWFFDRVRVSAIDCPYPCDNTCHNLVSK